MLSPDLVAIYSDIIMRALEGMPGIKVGGYNMNNIRYADDTVLIADNENELQEMLDTVVRESEKKGLSLNKKKTEVMVISKKNCTPTCNIVMNGTVLKQVHTFNYLGSLNEQHQEKTSSISRPCDEKWKARAFVDNRKDRRKKKQRSSKNKKNTRRFSSLAGKKHCGDVCGCKRSRKVEGHDRQRLQQPRQLNKK